MRVGLNPHKDKVLEKSDYKHQVIIPVYIPNQEDYFKDSFKIFDLCIQSLAATVHKQTFVSIVNNGSCLEVREYLEDLFRKNVIHELIHTDNIGKLNAILKGLAGNNIELVTIADSDVLFQANWQSETEKVFQYINKAGVVGIVPQFKMYETGCGNVIFDNLWNRNLKFIPVKNPEAIQQFYDSIGWQRDYNENYVKYGLGLEMQDLKVFVGSGHFVATYKKQMFEEMKSYLGYKLGGDSEHYLDTIPLEYDFWRLTTHDNYAYHMGNVFENWMVIPDKKQDTELGPQIHFQRHRKIGRFLFILKNRVFYKLYKVGFLHRMFFHWRKLPSEMVKDYVLVQPNAKNKN